MAVRLRLARHGAKKTPFYRIVAADGRSPRDGRFLEVVGTYDPMKEPADVRLKQERIDYWVSVGATPTDTVRSLLRRARRTPDTVTFLDGAAAVAQQAAKAAKAAAPEAAPKKAAPAAPAAEVAAPEAPAAEAAAPEAPAAEAAAPEAPAAEAAAPEAPAADAAPEAAPAAAAEEAAAEETPAGDAE
jgi:small subunit ribosomal protein S16